MTIALKYLLFITLIILFSCTSKVAKIELRKNVHFPQQISQENMNLDFLEESKNSKKAYLVNTSLNNTYEFTIREISTIDDTLVEYQTNKLTLSPGDEELIGGTKYLLGSKYAMSIVPDTIFTDTNLKEENVYEYKKSKFTETMELIYHSLQTECGSAANLIGPSPRPGLSSRRRSPSTSPTTCCSQAPTKTAT